MDLQGIIQRVQSQFGDTSGAQITTTEITRWANDGQLDIAKKTNILEDSIAVNTVKDQSEYDFPTGTLKIRRIEFKGAPLKAISFEELDNYFPSRHATTSPSGTPSYYYNWGQKYHVHPKPEVSETGALTVYYIKKPTPLVNYSDVPDIPEEYHEDLVVYCLYKAKEKDEENEEASKLQREYEIRLSDSKDDKDTRLFDSYPAIRDLPGDDW